MTIDIFSAKTLVDSKINNLSGVSGTGVLISDNKIIVYINDYQTEQNVRSIIGNNIEGYELFFVYTGKISVFL